MSSLWKHELEAADHVLHDENLPEKLKGFRSVRTHAIGNKTDEVVPWADGGEKHCHDTGENRETLNTFVLDFDVF